MKNKSPWWVTFVLILMGCGARADWVTLNILVDGVVIGEVPVDLREQKPVSLNGEELLKLVEPYMAYEKVQRLTKLLTDDKSLSLEDLNRVGIGSEYSEKDLALQLTIPLSMRVVKDFPLAMKRGRTGKSMYDKSFSGFFNYSLLGSYTVETRPDATGTVTTRREEPKEGAFELVQNFAWFTLESTANYHEFEADPVQRADTAVVHDFEDWQMRLRLGDFFADTQAFQSSLSVAGGQLKKQFSIYPEKGSLSKRSTTIQVKNNSVMKVYVNGNLITSLRVSRGPYNLRELPVLFGRNKVTVILTDEFGGRERYDIDLFFDDQILAEGVHNFSYQIGSPSYFTGNEKQYYRKVFGSFFHQYGMTDQLTVSLNYQTYQTARLIGVGTGLLTLIGTNILDYAYYTDDSIVVAHAGRWRYSSPDISTTYISGVRLLGGAELRSKDFRTITALNPQASTFSEKYDFIFQKQLGLDHSFNLSFTKLEGQNGALGSLNRRLGFQSQFARGWVLDLAYNWSDRDTDLEQVQASLTWIEAEGNALASLSHSTTDNATALRFAKNNRLKYNDYQLAGLVSKQSLPDRSGEAENAVLSGDYLGRVFESRLKLTGGRTGPAGSSETTSTVQLGLRSAVAWTVDGVALARPVSDSFAIVSPQGLSDDSFLAIPNGAEKENLHLQNNEDFVFHDLTAYFANRLQIDSSELPIGRYLERESYVIIPKYRSGVFIPLNVIRAFSVKGVLHAENEEFYNYAYGKILTREGKVYSNNFFTDEKGRFVIDGITAGEYEIELSDPRLKKISIEIKDSETSEVDLGTIEIEKEAGT